MWERPSLMILKESISDPTNPIGMRMRAAYYLRQAYNDCIINEENHQAEEEEEEENKKTCDDQQSSSSSSSSSVREAVITILCEQLQNRDHGSLMRHEFAYVLGQLRNPSSVQALQQVLLNATDCVMVRHEAAEALGAIGDADSRPFLQHIIDRGSAIVNKENDIDKEKEAAGEPIELVDTCRLADHLIAWRMDPTTSTDDGAPVGCACMANPYNTVDPAPPVHRAHEGLSDRQLGDMVRDGSIDLFDRYRAMFTLRNRRAVAELCHVLVTDTSSALLRHEVAYVLGQLQHADSIPALSESLRRPTEHFMVRHESAESLGAIMEGGQWETVSKILTEFADNDDVDIVVRESCLVAIDAADYWGNTTRTTSADETQSSSSSPSSFAKEKAK